MLLFLIYDTATTLDETAGGMQLLQAETKSGEASGNSLNGFLGNFFHFGTPNMILYIWLPVYKLAITTA